MRLAAVLRGSLHAALQDASTWLSQLSANSHSHASAAPDWLMRSGAPRGASRVRDSRQWLRRRRERRREEPPRKTLATGEPRETGSAHAGDAIGRRADRGAEECVSQSGAGRCQRRQSLDVSALSPDSDCANEIRSPANGTVHVLPPLMTGYFFALNDRLFEKNGSTFCSIRSTTRLVWSPS